ncbi:hypothetical protein F4805DRAFT_449234 [Annulohypoxylon moriforme]|nr:hypothetical protein F4805DRAFT_449234 [Annulohypoxylon moriforme]
MRFSPMAQSHQDVAVAFLVLLLLTRNNEGYDRQKYPLFNTCVGNSTAAYSSCVYFRGDGTRMIMRCDVSLSPLPKSDIS